MEFADRALRVVSDRCDDGGEQVYGIADSTHIYPLQFQMFCLLLLYSLDSLQPRQQTYETSYTGKYDSASGIVPIA